MTAGVRLPWPSRIDHQPMLVLSLSLLAAALVWFDGPPALRLPVGLIAALLLPGYSLHAILGLDSGDLGIIEHLALDFVLSLAVIAILALGLNYAPWGLTPISIVLMLTVWTCLTTARRLVAASWMLFSQQQVSFRAEVRISSDQLGGRYHSHSDPRGGRSLTRVHSERVATADDRVLRAWPTGVGGRISAHRRAGRSRHRHTRDHESGGHGGELPCGTGDGYEPAGCHRTRGARPTARRGTAR